MRVVHLVSDDIGGAGRAARRISDALNKNGVNSKVFVLEQYDQQSRTERVLNSPYKRFVFKCIRKIYQQLDHRKYDLKRFSKINFGLNREVWKLVKDADIVHLHWINYSFVSQSALKRLMTKKPTVWTLHDMWPFTAGCYYDGECNGYRSGCLKCSQVSSVKTVASARRAKEDIYKNADYLVFSGCSEWISDCARRSFLTNKFDVITIPNPIDTDIFRCVKTERIKKKYDIPSTQKIILFGAMTSDSDQRKGFDILKSAIKKLPSEQYVAIVFGNKNKIEENLGLRVIGLGMINDDAILAEMYSSADVFVAPSRQENLSNAVLESLSCGTPVVAFDIGGMKDMISHLENGYLASPFDESDLAKGIAYCAQNKEKGMGAKARTVVCEKFSESRIGKKYLQLYEEVIGDAIKLY